MGINPRQKKTRTRNVEKQEGNHAAAAVTYCTTQCVANVWKPMQTPSHGVALAYGVKLLNDLRYCIIAIITLTLWGLDQVHVQRRCVGQYFPAALHGAEDVGPHFFGQLHDGRRHELPRDRERGTSGSRPLRRPPALRFAWPDAQAAMFPCGLLPLTSQRGEPSRSL